MEEARLAHYVEFFHFGLRAEGTSSAKIKERDSEFEFPIDCVGYRFFDRTELGYGEETLRGDPKNHSVKTYFGTVINLEEVKRDWPERDDLVKKMNGGKRVVKTNLGTVEAIDSEDNVVPRT